MKRIAWTLGASLLLVVNAAQAQSGPEAPIKLIIPFGAGTSVDSTARAFGKALSEVTKQAVVIDNRAGAEGLRQR